MGIRHVREARADWQRTLTAGLAYAVEGLFLLTLVALPLDVYLEAPDGRAIGYLSQALTLEMCALFGVALAASALLLQPTRLWPRPRELAPLAAALLAALASAIVATSHSAALAASLNVFVALGIFMVARAMLTRPHARSHALLALLAGVTLVLVAGFFGAAPGSPDIAGAALNIQRAPAALTDAGATGVAATFRSSSELAAYLVIIIPLLTACAITSRAWADRAGYGVLAFAAGVLLLLTSTSGALLGVAVALLVLLWALGGYRLALAGLAIMLCCGLALVFIPSPISSSLAPGGASAAGWQVAQLSVWRWAGSTFLHHPLLGVGIGAIGLQSNAPLVNGAPALDAESLILNVLAEMGMLGGLAVGLCFYAGIRLALTGVRESHGWLDRGWNAGALAALVGALVYGITDPVLVSGQVTGLLCALAGLAGSELPYPVERLGLTMDHWKGALSALRALALSNPLSRQRERQIGAPTERRPVGARVSDTREAGDIL